MNEYDAMLYIRRRFPDTTFRRQDDIRQGELFNGSHLAIWVPKTWFRQTAYHVHEIRVDRLLGQRVEVVEFSEARHVGA
jgi:hypothetical protein